MINFEKNKIFSLFDPVTIASFLILVAAIISNLTSYKVIEFMGVEASLGTFTMPLILMLLNPIAEVYGKERSNQILFATCMLEICFSVLFTSLSHLQRNCNVIQLTSDKDHCEALNAAYTLISQNIIRGSISFSVGCMIGSYFNTRFLLYLKSLWSSGKYYIRDVFSSLIGEVLYTAACFMMAFYGVFPLLTIVKIFAFSLSFKFFATLALSWISQVVVKILGKHKAWTENMPSTKKVRFFSRHIQV